MKERPILFSGAMVRAILDGRKTQTRRLVKCPVWVGGIADDERPSYTHVYGAVATVIPCPYGQPGDRLWVRESFTLCESIRADGHRAPLYRATSIVDAEAKWKPSIHMPRWASRLTLEIVSLRVERLQDITEADAILEGIEDKQMVDGVPMWTSAVEAYADLWDSINGEGSWAANPWVWVVEFTAVNVELCQPCPPSTPPRQETADGQGLA